MIQELIINASVSDLHLYQTFGHVEKGTIAINGSKILILQDK